MDKMNKYRSASGFWLIATILILGELWVALDGYQYWHDVRFAYATTEFSLAEVVAGNFNPHQAWSDINLVSSSGFYSSKILHMTLLHSLFAAVPPDAGGFDLAVGLSVLTMTSIVLLAYLLYFQLLRSRKVALYAVVCVLLAPVVPYLAGKFLSEISSLFFVTASLLLLSIANHTAAEKKLLLALSSGLLLAMAGLARLDSLFGPIGFFLASAIIPLNHWSRAVVSRNIFIASSVFVVVYLSVLISAGPGVDAFYEYFLAFVNAGQKSVLMSLFGIATFGGVIYVLAIAGLFGMRTSITRFLILWLTITALPALIITWNYMVEPRYLIQSLLPLCALGALGIERIYNYLSGHGKNIRVITLLSVMFVMGLNYVLVRLMPYELDRPAILGAVAAITEAEPDASILIPWSYTDYNFLRLMLPDANIFNVNSSMNPSIDKAIESEWKARFHRWYGDKYITEQSKVDALLRKGPVYYLSWRVYPPVQNIHDFAAATGWNYLVAKLDNMQMKDHRKESWLWDSPDINMQFTGRSGQYEYYRVEGISK
jgi:hypothetical protein